MRVSSFSRGSVVAISAFAVIFLVTMYQVGNSLAKSRESFAGYQKLKALTTVQFYRTIANYLQSGDASLLNLADEQLTQISTSAQHIENKSLANEIVEKANSLSTEIDTKFRALGKLSGDPLALIRNNELGMISLNHALAKYALESESLNNEQRASYLLTTNHIARALYDIINTREKLFQQDSQNSQALPRQLAELTSQINALSQFPDLAIHAESDNDFGDDDLLLDDEAPEDLSLEALAELQSLAKRYRGEIDNTFNLQSQRQEGLTLLASRVAELEQSILNGETHLQQEQKALNTQLYWVVTGLLTFLMVFLIANYWLTRSVVLNPLRKLRDSFVTLVNEGRVDNITGISPHTELGEISTSFNQMVSKLAEEDKQKAQQLNLVSNAMQTMEHQAQNILDSSSTTHEHLIAAKEILVALTQVTDHVNTLSQQVVDNAQSTEQAMNNSQTKVQEVLIASEETNQAANAGREAILTLTQSVESVGSIVDVISSIADQTNLLALNAAIEAARAGEHGRGFSVVADEVRQLAGKTQESLNQVSQRLEQLNQASQTLEQNIYGIERASDQQRQIAEVLRDNAANVVQRAITSANVAADTLAQINQQRSHFADFEHAMGSVNNEVSHSRKLAENISKDVAEQVSDIHATLKLVVN
ncbi:methyl-accepting chemotaxis protein [Thalassotalea fusca]